MINNRDVSRWGSVLIPPRVAERAAFKFTLVDDCHISTYSVASHGYAQIGWRDGSKHFGTTAHRAAWVYYHGQIPVGMTVDHIQSKCTSRRCVREDHLRLLENFENARRTHGRNWILGGCIEGHPNDGLVSYGGKRKCRLCLLQRQRDYRARNREKVAQRQRDYRARKREIV